MPVPPGLLRLTITGTLPGGEEMVHTLHGFGSSDPDVPQVLQDVCDRVRDAWVSFLTTQPAGTETLTSMAGTVSNQVAYNVVQAYVLDATGRALTQVQSPFANPNIAAGGSGMCPPQTSMAISLLTARAGRTGRGRVYLGGIGRGALAVDGRYNSETTTVVSRGFRDMVQALNNPGSGSFSLVVASRTTGTTSPVREIRVGNVPDVQRRRRAGLREVYASAPVVT